MTRDTDPHELTDSQPPSSDVDTGPIKGADDVRLYLELDGIRARLEVIASHLLGRIEGHDVELAQSNAFEKRISGAIQFVSHQSDKLQATMDTVELLCRDISNGMFDHQQRIVNLETWRKEHVRVENHCENCEYKRQGEVKQL